MDMKELSIEEKAKAYDEAKLRMSAAYNNNRCTIDFMNEIFPETTESEDEKIRKELIAEVKEQIDCIPAPDCRDKEDDKALKRLNKKQGEKKSADKIEPKFKVGDWVVNKGHSYLIAYIDYEQRRYLFEIGGYTHEQLNWEYIENADNKYHLWTIQDANDGDVLVASDGSIFLFKGANDCACKHYVALIADGAVKFNEGLEHYWESSIAVHPATKEQRDQLEKAITEAGYEWDAKNRQLRKIESFNKYEGFTDFENTLADICIGWIGEEHGWKQYIKDNADVLLKIAIEKFNSVQDAPFEQKPTWSEQDEKMFNSALWHVKNSCGNGGKNSGEFEVYNWLKSLKDRYTWKPSAEQMDALNLAIGEANSVDTAAGDEAAEILTSLYEQLKKLREE